MTLPGLERALALARRGWPVLPIESPSSEGDDKRPIGSLVPNGHKDATTDEQTIRAWWASRPDARVGLALEPSGLVALDVDPKGDGWQDSYTELEPQLTATTQQTTPSGGAHALYARTDPGQSRRMVRWRPGIDLLGRGYVVVYQDLAGDPAPLPEVLAKAFTERPTREVKPLDVDHDFEPASEALLAYARHLAMEHGGKAKGEGGNHHAYQLGAILLNDLALTWEEAWPIVLEWKEFFPETRGWREEYLAETVQHAARYATASRGTGRLDLAVLEGAIEARDRPFVAPAKGSWEEALLKAKEDLEAYRGTGAGGQVRGPAFSPATNLLTTEFPPTPWLIQGLVTENSVGVTSAEPKSIKTWLELENALAVATGTKSMGEFPTGKPRAVALFLAEDDARAARNRLTALCKSRGLDPAEALKNVHVCCRQHLNLTQDTDLVWILASCRRIEDLALVMLDPLRDVHAAEENDSTGMADVMGRLRAVRDIVSCAVRTPHHAKKESSGKSDRGGQNMRGSSAIHGALDCGLYLDGLDTDGQSKWTVRATSEIKAAKGAGVFTVTLEVQDNANGEAMAATWKVERGKSAKSKAVERAEHDAKTKLGEILNALQEADLLRGKRSLGVNALTKASGGGGRDLIKAALDLGEGRGFLVPHSRGDQALGYRITDAGKAWLKGPPDAPQV